MKGIFVASTPSRARRRQKGTRAAGHHFAIAGIADRNANPGLTGASSLCVARGAARKSPTFRGSSPGQYAVRPPLTPGLKSGIHLIAGRPLGIRERTARERKGDAARIDGSSMNAARQRKSITFPGDSDEANVRYLPLIGHSGTASTSQLTGPSLGRYSCLNPAMARRVAAPIGYDRA